ncbi:MAG: holin family protein [Paracoccaceae bacterium]
MGLMRRIFGPPAAVGEVASAITGVAEVFAPNATRKMALGHADFQAALGQYGLEFQLARAGMFDRLVDALNRLPRPALALGTLGLFVFAMASPERFSVRMQGLSHVPEPLWWLLGAIVSFYFGAREMHYVRTRGLRASAPMEALDSGAGIAARASANPALMDWQANPDP